jgi:hypothetical protein
MPMLLVVGVDAVNPRTVPAGTRERTHVVFAIAAGTNVLKTVLIIVVVAVSKVFNTFLATVAFIMETGRLGTMTSLQTSNRSADRVVEDRAKAG